MFGFLKKGQKSIGHSGSDTYKYIDPLLNDNGKTLRVCTPYLGIGYAKMLLSLAKRKHIYLLVSGDSKKKDEEAVRLILSKGKRIDVRLVLYALFIVIPIIYFRQYVIAFGVIATLAIYIYASASFLPKLRTIKIRIATKRFVHEKLYISEKRAIVGSANLTYAGTHKNIEHIEIISDEKKVQELRKHFEEMWARA